MLVNFDWEFDALEMPQEQQDFGTALEARGWLTKLQGRIGDSPRCFSVDSYYRKAGLSVPEDYDLGDRFQLCVVENVVAVIKEGKFAEPVIVGFSVEFRNDAIGLNPGLPCRIFLVKPSPEYITRGSVDFGAHSTLAFSIMDSEWLRRPEIRAEPPAMQSSAGLLEFDRLLGDLGSLQIGTSLKAEGQLLLQARVQTPKVTAVGVGSTAAEWSFTSVDSPLYGKDIFCWAGLVLPKSKKRLKYRARMFITARAAFVPTRHYSDWIDLTCELPVWQADQH